MSIEVKNKKSEYEVVAAGLTLEVKDYGGGTGQVMFENTYVAVADLDEVIEALTMIKRMVGEAS